MKITTLSIVIPVYNEAHNILPMRQALRDVWEKLSGYVPEIIFVDDGSVDLTWETIVRLAEEDKTVEGVRLARNFGKEAAIEAGLKKAKGEAVIIMDGDLQHPPELIPALVEKWKEGKDIVRAVHPRAPHTNPLKRVRSALFYSFFNSISDTKITPGSSDFCLLSKRVVQELSILSEKQKFHRALSEWVGFPSTSIEYVAHGRASGGSTYTTKKLLTLARNAIVSSSSFPMTLIFLVGCLLSLLGALLVGGLLAYKYFVDFEYIGGAVVLAAFVVFNNGLLLIAFGIMSLYQVATYREVQNRPNFIVQDIV